MQSARFAVSVVLPFGDHEDVIGAAVQHLAGLLRTSGLGFELLAVDESSGDNSHAVLALLRAQVPELRVVQAAGPGRGFDAGLARAQGRVAWLVAPGWALQASAGALGELERLLEDDGATDAVLARGRHAVLRRARVLDAAAGLRGTGDLYLRRLARRLAARGLRVDGDRGLGAGGAGRAPVAAPLALGGFRRLREAFVARRAAVEKNP